MTEDWTGKTAIVTGAGQGIGYGICEALAVAGCFVALNDMNGELAKQAAMKINTQIGEERVFAYQGDVADVFRVREIVNLFGDIYGRLDIAVANAGITNFGPFLTYTPEAFDRVMGINLRGSYFTAQAAAQKMIAFEKGDGRILLMSSVTGKQAYQNLSAYGVTKAGIMHMAKALAVELGEYGITVNGICPGATVTERTLIDDPQYAENWAAVTPTGRAGSVADIVQTALFLSSQGGRQITGQTLMVDGGWTLQSLIPPATPDMPKESSKLK